LLIILLLMLLSKAIVLNYFSNSLFVVFYINYSILVSYLNVFSSISLAFLTIFLNILKFDTTIYFDNIQRLSIYASKNTLKQ